MAEGKLPFKYDETTFRELFDTYLKKVHDYISALSHSNYIADEVTQELFIILWRKRDDLFQVLNMDQYVFRIARNLAIKLLRKAAIDGKLAGALYDNSVRMKGFAEEQSQLRDIQHVIDKAVLLLPPQPRKVYLLSRREHLNFDEISAATGLSRNTVKNHLNKALRDIREYLLAHGYQPVIILLALLHSFKR